MKKRLASILLAVILLLSISGIAYADIITFDNFTEDDPGSYIAKTSERVSWIAMPRSSLAQVSYDMSSSNFSDNWTMYGAYNIACANSAQVNILVLSDNVSAWGEGYAANDNGIGVTFNEAPVTEGMEINEWYGGSSHAGSEVESASLQGQWRYYKYHRDASTGANGTVTFSVYSDKTFDTLIQSVTKTCANAYDYQYFIPLQNAGLAGAFTTNGFLSSVYYYEGSDGSDPVIIDSGNDPQVPANDPDSGYPSYCDADNIYWIYVNDDWINSGSCAEDNDPVAVLSDPIQTSVDNLRERWGWDNIEGGYIIGLLFMLIVASIAYYYRWPKPVFIGLEAVAFGICFVLGWFEIWLIVIGAVLVAVFMWWRIGGRNKEA